MLKDKKQWEKDKMLVVKSESCGRGLKDTFKSLQTTISNLMKMAESCLRG